MKLKYLQITLTPEKLDGETEMDVRVEVGGNIFTNKTIIADDHFEDLFSRLMKRAEKKIRLALLATDKG